MYTTVQLMSGDIHEFPISDTTRVVDLKYDVATMLYVDARRVVVFHKRSQDFYPANAHHVIEEGEHFYVLVKDLPPPPTTVYLDFTGQGYILRKETGEVLIDFNLPIDLSLVPESLTLIIRTFEQDSLMYIREILQDFERPNRFELFSRYYDMFIAPSIADRVLVTIFN